MDLTEKQYGELYKHSLKQAQRFVGYADSAYDLAQNAILAYLSSPTIIEKPIPWLSTVVKREAFKLKALQSNERKLIQDSAAEFKAGTDDQHTESLNLASVSVQKIRHYLDAREFSRYQLLKKYDFSPAKCSEQENIPFQTAKSDLHKIKKNIIAGYLFEEGWRHGIRILNFKQYYNISRGINKLIECVKCQKLSQIRSYFRKVDNELLESVLAGVTSCLEWNVTYDSNLYKLFLVCLTQSSAPKFIEIAFRFNQANFMFIIDVVEKKPFMSANTSIDKVTRYKEKGKITLTEAQIIAFISDSQINN